LIFLLEAKGKYGRLDQEEFVNGVHEVIEYSVAPLVTAFVFVFVFEFNTDEIRKKIAP
jgi:hypothetical protein